MKRYIVTGLVAASISMYGCSQQGQPTPASTPAPAATSAATPIATETPTAAATPEAKEGLPYDFQAAKPDAKPGQFVFVPMASSIEKLMKGQDKRFSDMRPRELVKIGEETSTINDRSEFEAPNSLIITTEPDAKAAVGDVVLGQPQYSSMEIGIVTDASDPAAPAVHFFKPVYSGQPEGDKFNGKLEPGKFRVLDSELEPGTHALYPDGEETGYGQVINVEGDKVLMTKFGGDLEVFNKADVTPIPTKPGVKDGDKVRAPFGKGVDPATVSKVDEKIGRIWVKFDGREGQGEKIFCYGEILPGQ